MAWHVVGDWGTTRLRLFRIEAGSVVDRIDGPGIGALTEPPRDVLLRLLSRWDSHGRPDHVVLCGMAGARNGLLEAPYVPCPADAQAWMRGAACFDLEGYALRIASGVRRDDEDAMRGEETQIFGALARDDVLTGGRRQFILPGTHSKWVLVEDGVIRAFRTYFTGELFALLKDHSSLSVTSSDAADPLEMREGWREGLARATGSPSLVGDLFRARSAQLLRGKGMGWAEAFLSGLLIGTEIEEARRNAALPGEVVLIGSPGLVDHYRAALDHHDVAVRAEDGDACVLAGLEMLHDHH